MQIRVCLRNVNSDGDRLRFDLTLHPDLKPVADKVYFGFWGAVGGVGDAFGVLLSPEGVIDLGSGYELYDRFHKTNLMQRQVTLGQYVTVWWDWGGNKEENTYQMEAVIQLSAVTELVTLQRATGLLVTHMSDLPRFRARVIRSFDIKGYDGRIYRPPVGVQGDVAILQSITIFCPDNAVAKNGQLITVAVDPKDIELLADSGLR